jgi:hypothetical protein
MNVIQIRHGAQYNMEYTIYQLKNYYSSYTEMNIE